MKPGSGVGIMVLKDNKILLGLRKTNKDKNTEIDGYETWSMPGGKVEYLEKLVDAAKRELKEETNLDIIDSTMVKVLSGKDTYREYPNGDKLYDITAIFVITNYSGDLKVNDEESKKLEWFGIDKLPENITSHTRNYLEKYGDILKEALIIYENK